MKHILAVLLIMVSANAYANIRDRVRHVNRTEKDTICQLVRMMNHEQREQWATALQINAAERRRIRVECRI